jgi:NarL family two-component system response regulator LiaR
VTGPGSASPLRVLLVDDDDGLRTAIRVLLRHHPGWEVAGEARDGTRAVELARQLQPDVALLDLVMQTPGDQALPHLLSVAPTCMVAVLSGLSGEHVEQRLLRLGAFCYYEKDRLDTLPDRLDEAYRRFQRAMAGEDVVAAWLA